MTFCAKNSVIDYVSLRKGTYSKVSNAEGIMKTVRLGAELHYLFIITRVFHDQYRKHCL